jgi:hypothetical protein
MGKTSRRQFLKFLGIGGAVAPTVPFMIKARAVTRPVEIASQSPKIEVWDVTKLKSVTIHNSPRGLGHRVFIHPSQVEELKNSKGEPWVGELRDELDSLLEGLKNA